MKKSLILITIFCFCAYISFAQTQISGVINKYTRVESILPCNQIEVRSSSRFSVGDMVLIIQMKGAAIITANAANFGNIMYYKNAGNYEFNYIKAVDANIITLKYLLEREYDVPEGVVQLVMVPEYDNAEVNGTLTCMTWNKDEGIGGVLALHVYNILDLRANVDVGGRGFTGGDISETQGYINVKDYYSSNTSASAEKGEGIVVLSSPYLYARGKAANGGGGGNAHNGGGGGGGNYNGGGDGGGNLDTICPGFGGKSGALLDYEAENRVFLGGGGGGAEANEGLFGKGGNGGAIVFIIANRIYGNKRSIISNGSEGEDSYLDGSGGGGGGGVVFLETHNIVSGLKIEVDGGGGGNGIAGGRHAAGSAGGGGGGGAIITSLVHFPQFTGSYVLISVRGGEERNNERSC